MSAKAMHAALLEQLQDLGVASSCGQLPQGQGYLRIVQKTSRKTINAKLITEAFDLSVKHFASSVDRGAAAPQGSLSDIFKGVFKTNLDAVATTQLPPKIVHTKRAPRGVEGVIEVSSNVAAKTREWLETDAAEREQRRAQREQAAAEAAEADEGSKPDPVEGGTESGEGPRAKKPKLESTAVQSKLDRILTSEFADMTVSSWDEVQRELSKNRLQRVRVMLLDEFL